LLPRLRLADPASAPKVWRARVDSGLIYFAIAALADSIFALTASRLKLAPRCMRKFDRRHRQLFHCCWTNTKRQNRI